MATTLACAISETTEVPDQTGGTQPSAPPASNDPQVAYEYGGDGTYTQVSVLAGDSSSCTIPVAGSATIDENGAVSIESVGSCINDFNGCKPDESDLCAMYGNGTAGGSAMAAGGPIDMTGCNTGAFAIGAEDVEFDSDRLVGSFQCDLGGGDSMNLSMDIPRIKK